MHSDKKEQKLAEIYEKYKNRMYIAACRITKDPYLAEDAVHDVFLSISGNTGFLDDADSLKTASYVIKSAKNRAINIMKKTRSESLSFLSDNETADEENTLDMICSEENYSYVVSAVLSLDEKYRDVLSLYYFNELTVKEIAEALGKKENTVKGQLARGRRKLIKLIKEEADINEKEFSSTIGF